MIKEIVQFVNRMPEEFKNTGIKPREGLHVLFTLQDDGTLKRDFSYEFYSKKTEESDFLKKCALLSLHAWCIDTNKCFDAPAKSIHSCSPFCIAFKRENLEGGEKYRSNKGEQIHERFNSKYFPKAWDLLKDEDQLYYSAYKDVFIRNDHSFYFESILQQIDEKRSEERLQLQEETARLKELQKSAKKDEKDRFKEDLENLSIKLEAVKPLTDSDYIIFYLDVPLDKYKEVHQTYLSDKLFNTSEFNSLPDEQGILLGTSDFFNGFPDKKPFLCHRTASFDIAGRISSKDSQVLYEFKQMLPRKILPNPLPVFIFEEELPLNEQLQPKVIGVFKESGYKMGYKELIEKIWEQHQQEFANYYLLFYQNTKDGLVFRDYDFITKFEYKLKDDHFDGWQIEDYFDIDYHPLLKNIFEFQNQIVQTIFNNNLIVRTKDAMQGDGKGWIYKYFDEIDEQWCKSSRNYLLIMKYRQAFYDYIYKSRRNAVTGYAFDEIMQTGILEDIRLDEYKGNQHSEYFNIRRKLNIWFSLADKFNSKTKNMASNLKKYQDFVAQLAVGTANLDEATNEYFAFAAGQVVDYVLQKSRTEDRSYLLLEPYLQQAKCSEFKKAIANDIARYKHAINDNETRFKAVCAFVQTWEMDNNMKDLLPELLAGIFSKNQFFTIKAEDKQ